MIIDFFKEVIAFVLLVFVLLPIILMIALWSWIIEPDYDKLAEESYYERE